MAKLKMRGLICSTITCLPIYLRLKLLAATEVDFCGMFASVRTSGLFVRLQSM